MTTEELLWMLANMGGGYITLEAVGNKITAEAMTMDEDGKSYSAQGVTGRADTVEGALDGLVKGLSQPGPE